MLRLALSAAVLGAVAAADSPSSHSYGPWQVRPALHYFRRWAEGRVAQELAKLGAHEAAAPAPYGGEAMIAAALDAHHLQICGQAYGLALDVHSTAYDDGSSTWHALLRTERGGLQYVAARGHRVLTTDPVIKCPRPARQPEGLFSAVLRRLNGDIDQSEVPIEEEMTGNREALVHPQHDEMVKDCEELFRRTADENCKETFDIKVLSATMGVVAGMELKLVAEITGKSGKTAEHHVTCVFQEANKTALKESLEDVSKKEMLDEEKEGMTATIIMANDICEADEPSTNPAPAQTARLLKLYSMGELSRYKGFEHVNDDIPEWPAVRQLDDLPEEVNLMTKYKKCFPRDGAAVVRNQGNCGCCWAFASASALMATLCISKGGEYDSDGVNRYEVSVQRVITCNPKQLGCNGGYAQAAHDTFTNIKIAHEGDAPYKCSGGNPLNHFLEKSQTCDKYPWGGETAICDISRASTEWSYMGSFRQKTEPNMMKALAAGNALYVTIDVPEDFMKYSKGVFTNDPPSEVVGGHALVCVGYGVDNGVKYWLLQNSWGRTWGLNGYAKVLRGKNVMKIEDGGVAFLGVTAGGKTPAETGKPIAADAPPAESSSPLGAIGEKLGSFWNSILGRIRGGQSKRLLLEGGAAGRVPSADAAAAIVAPRAAQDDEGLPIMRGIMLPALGLAAVLASMSYMLARAWRRPGATAEYAQVAE